MIMYPKDSKNGVNVSQAQVETLEKAGWTKELGKAPEAQETKTEVEKVETTTATPKPAPKPATPAAPKK